MTAPILETLSRKEAINELNQLKAEVEGGFDEFEMRAYSYNLTPSEFAVWERISELCWLLGEE